MKKLAIIAGVAVTVILAIVLFVIRVAKKAVKEVKETSEEIIVTLFTFALTEDEGILEDFSGLYTKLMSIPGVKKVELRDLENKLNPEIVIKLEPGIKKTPELVSQVSDIMKQVEDYVLDID